MATMCSAGKRMPRGRRAVLIAIALFAALLVGCGSSDDSGENAQIGDPPDAAKTVMTKTPYQAARWSYLVQDLDSGDTVLENQPDTMNFTGSTAKLFTIGTAYDVLGPDHEIKTPVYAVGSRNGGTLSGDLVLVAKGDLALGGRGATHGRFDYTDIDQVYADQVPGATSTGDNPLAGLDELAREVRRSGIERIDGDVLIDTRLWQPYQGQAGVVTPIFVNDNLVTITVHPTQAGRPARVSFTPRNDLFRGEARVRTVSKDDKDAALALSTGSGGRIVVSGQIQEGAQPELQVFPVPDPGQWARSLFIDALRRAGVKVSANPTGPNNDSALPGNGAYKGSKEVASLTAPPLSKAGTMILHTSYDSGANAVLCLLAVEKGSRNCQAGLSTIRSVIARAGVDGHQVVIADGQGAPPASTTPRQIVDWLKWTTDQPWGKAFENALPVLGESGTLGITGKHSPARGKVLAKPGTVGVGVPGTQNLLFEVEGLAGFLDTDDGRQVFSLYVSNALFPNGAQGIITVSDEVAAVAAQFQQAQP